MNKYTIYCTPSQTQKARELGAPIRHPLVDNPTAEQMIGWLEEQEEISDIQISKLPGIWNYGVGLSSSDTYLSEYGFSRKEVTLAAIDEALRYLSRIESDEMD